MNYLAIDWGQKHIGLARASAAARIAQPLTSLSNDSLLVVNLRKLVSQEGIKQLIIGLPRNLEGRQTAQSAEIKQFAQHLGASLTLPVHLQDETLTSQQAQSSRDPKVDVHARSAAIILQDYLDNL